MTCTQAAEIFERVVAERKKKRGVPAMRYRQMERIAGRLREHGDEDRFADDVGDMLRDLDSLQLMSMEVAMNTWWDEWPKSTEPR